MARSVRYAFESGVLAGLELRIWAKNRTYGAVIVAELRQGSEMLGRVECSRQDTDTPCTLARSARDGDTDAASELALDLLEMAH